MSWKKVVVSWRKVIVLTADDSKVVSYKERTDILVIMPETERASSVALHSIWLTRIQV